MRDRVSLIKKCVEEEAAGPAQITALWRTDVVAFLVTEDLIRIPSWRLGLVVF